MGPDLAAVLVCAPFVVAGLSSLPFGDHPHAAYLFGADAGEWALNAQFVREGTPSSVDHHRGAPFVLAIALARFCSTDLARAGHLVCAAAWAVRPFALYALGRMCGGRLVGLIAALLTASLLPLYYSAAKYGVDPFLTTMLPLALVSVGPARRYPRWAWVSGAFVGSVMLTHLTAAPYCLPALLLLIWRGGSPDRPTSPWARPLLFVSGMLATLLLVRLSFGLIDPHELMHSISEGVVKGSAGNPGEVVLSDRASATLAAGRHLAATDATQSLVLPFLNELDQWPLYMGAIWFGLVGASLGCVRSVPTLTAVRHPLLRHLSTLQRTVRSDLGTGIILLTTLAPAPFYAAAEAPERYTANLLPFVALLVARGIGSASWSACRLLPAAAMQSGRGVCIVSALAVLLPLTWTRLTTAQAFVSPPGREAISARALSNSVRRHVDSDSGVATPIREVAAYLERPHCPRASCMPGPGETAFQRCVAHLRSECPGTGPIPLVWVQQGPVGMGDDAFLQAFGAWASEQYGAAGRYNGESLKAVIIKLPRSDDLTPSR